MTPLAARVAKELMLPEKRRRIQQADGVMEAGLLGRDTHCFDVGTTTPVMMQTLAELGWTDVEPLLCGLFLPSPVTWLEPVGWSAIPMAYVLRQEGGAFTVYYFHADEDGIVAMELGKFRPKPDNSVELIPSDGVTLVWPEGTLEDHSLASVVARCGVLLSLINAGAADTRDRPAHKGLRRKLRKHNLDAWNIERWTEVVLTPGAPSTATMRAEDHADAVRRCLHFVRSHSRRLPKGDTTVVKAHWKGDAALGVKGTRYKVAAPWQQ